MAGRDLQSIIDYHSARCALESSLCRTAEYWSLAFY